MRNEKDEDLDDGVEDWIGADSIRAYWAAWRRPTADRPAKPRDEEDGDGD